MSPPGAGCGASIIERADAGHRELAEATALPLLPGEEPALRTGHRAPSAPDRTPAQRPTGYRALEPGHPGPLGLARDVATAWPTAGFEATSNR